MIYVNSSFADASEDHFKSTGGYILCLGETPIMWKSKKMKWVATSIAVAEFVAVNLVSRETMYLGHVLKELVQVNPLPLKVFSNSKAA
eukprot:snap_masked-scaffold_88-processed-gene-0.12-mRNA-1 protein AED:1.00 eAED:1.00 QI:0/-1/0/0/-1/1/1/0/87